MTISESLSISASKGVPVRCGRSQAQNHPGECVCRGTGTVIACKDCDGTGFNGKQQQKCSRCDGTGALSYQKLP